MPSSESLEASLSRRLIIAMVVPGVLLVLAGLLLLYQLRQLTETARWVDHTDQVIARTYALQNEISDQESALRGFLLSSDRTFLTRFLVASPAEGFDELLRLTGDNPAQSERLRAARALYDRWLAATEGVATGGASLDPYRTAAALLARKAHNDALREKLNEGLEVEQALRKQRAAAADSASELTFGALMVLLLGLAAALAFVSRRQMRAVADTYVNALNNEQSHRTALEAQNWARSAQVALADRVQGDIPIDDLASKALDVLAKQIGADVAAFYVAEPEGYRLKGRYALGSGAPEFFGPNEGLVGQAARENKLLRLRELPSDFLRIEAGVGARAPSEVLLVPASADGVVYAVLEFGFLRAAPERSVDLLERIGELLAVRVRSVSERRRLRELLEESQTQAEELQAQQEELRVANEELAQHGDALKGAHAQLEERQEELEASNAGLQAQRDALRDAQGALKDKATELERASQYKSEFLANMSHELRTPLNSTLILAKLLADNKLGNLTSEQVNFASSIYAAGNDLLALINDILDLSKIEAGKVDVHIVATTLGKLVEPVTKLFDPVADQKHLTFTLSLDQPDARVETDVTKAQQVLKNLLSNAFKFTERGEIALSVAAVSGEFRFVVKDSGIGIPKHQHGVIFEAFRQADGTTNRKFGGTGLGLSISRDLARLLGGELKVESEVGQGSTFEFTLPRDASQVRVATEGTPTSSPPPQIVRRNRPELPAPGPMPALDPSRRLLLIVEDDSRFAQIVARTAEELQFQTWVAHSANHAVQLALSQPPAAIILDINLPDHSGLTVLDRLKREPALRHVPIHVMSVEDHAQTALAMGAAGYLVKPVKRDELVAALESLSERFVRMRRLLVVEDDPVQRDAICRLLESAEVEIVAAPGVHTALEQLRSGTFDCVVTDLVLVDGSGYDLLESMANDEAYSFPPVIVYTGRSLTAEEEQRLRRHSSAIIVKGVRSPERLLDEVTLFLHQVESKLPPDRQRMLRSARDREAAFEGRKILLAEDDVRNVFALSSVFEPKGAKLLIARNGREAIEAVARETDIDLVLMDIMMPEVDGLEAIREIRRQGGRNAKLPIIALTAKAMRDDQERCLRAGANDYIAKPLDVDMLLSLSRVWMAR